MNDPVFVVASTGNRTGNQHLGGRSQGGTTAQKKEAGRKGGKAAAKKS